MSVKNIVRVVKIKAKLLMCDVDINVIRRNRYIMIIVIAFNEKIQKFFLMFSIFKSLRTIQVDFFLYKIISHTETNKYFLLNLKITQFLNVIFTKTSQLNF